MPDFIEFSLLLVAFETLKHIFPQTCTILCRLFN